MLFRVTRTGRNDTGTYVLHAVVGTQTARKQAVAVSHGESVVASDAVSRQASGHTLAPYADILAGIAYNSGIASSAAGSVNTDNLTLRSRLKAEGIVVAQVLLGGEGQLFDVLDGLNVIGADVHLLEFVTVEGHVVIDVFYNLMEPLALQGTHLVAAHAFFIGIPNHLFIYYLTIYDL